MTDPLHRLEAESTALVVVDIQEKLLPAVVEPERVLAATRLLLRAAAVLSLPVVVTTQYARGLGPTVAGIAELLPAGTEVLDKLSFSCFDDARFRALLDARLPRRRSLLVAGIESHICVAGTVFGALRGGLAVEVVEDAVSSRTRANAVLGFERMTAAGALRTSAEMAIYELLRESGSAAFKAMLPWFKELTGQPPSS